ncbi:DMT family transporter [Umezawaea beigongshangensis]|uniref:DMT family transporter n=1 Tax=Umezawaea beigongshangensis TaxID=2780383 RepID=UPI0018F14774|nr:DMT family transporter [Umezawaea beigongshangensis]
MTRRTAILCGAVATCVVGGSVPVNGVLQQYPVLSGQALRYALGAFALLVWAALRGQSLPRPAARDLPALLGVVATGMLGFNAGVLFAQRHAEPGFVAAVLGAAPVVLALLVPLLRRRRPAVAPVVGACVVVTGVVVLSGGGAWQGPGLVLALLALAGEVSFTLLAVGVVRRLGGLAVCVWTCLLAAATAAVLGTVVDGAAAWRAPTAREAVALLLLGTVLTAVAFGLWYAAVSRLGADRAGVLIGLMPVSGLVSSVALGAQDPRPVAVLGALVVAAGCVIALGGGALRRVSDRRAPSAARPEPSPAVPR